MERDPQIIRIVDFVDRVGAVRNEAFRDCLVQGPAILLPIGDVTFRECSFDAFQGDLDAVFVEIPEGPRQGMVGLDNVSFQNCAFQQIGFAGTAENVAEIRAAIGEPI